MLWLAALNFRPRVPPRSAVQMRLECDITLVGDPSSSPTLSMYDKLMRVKPYPPECPYDAASVFTPDNNGFGLQREPTRGERDALRQLVEQKKLLGKDARVLEIVCDGGSRLPRRGPESATLHLCAASLERAKRAPGTHVLVEMEALAESLPLAAFEERQFDVVLCHGCLPFMPNPPAVLAEIFRLLTPSGSLVASWRGEGASVRLGGGGGGSGGRDVEGVDRDANSPTAYRLKSEAGTSGWQQAADDADHLYMAGSFFRYSADWERLDVHELLGAGAEGGAPPLYALQALKLSNRATMVQRAQKDLFRTHSPDYKSREASAAEAAPLPPPPPPAAAAAPVLSRVDPETSARRPLQQGLRDAKRDARRQEEDLALRVRSKRAAGSGGGGGGSDPQAMVRQRILDTIKKGIAQSASRTDLADGDKKLLEHMQMYVMETKVAEADLSAEEAAIWESMKEQYLKTAEERRGGDGQ